MQEIRVEPFRPPSGDREPSEFWYRHDVVTFPELCRIGITEYVDIPTWGIARLRAKVDTGARSSALHVENIREVGPGRVRFDIRLSRYESARRVTVQAKISRRGQVRSSNGSVEPRIFVVVRLFIGELAREVELGLVDRGSMIFRMLIGRGALAGVCLVDPSRRYLLSRATVLETSKRSTARGTRNKARSDFA